MATAKCRAGWRKSTYSDVANGCVEVGFTSAGVQIRDSKIADSPVIAFTTEQWTAFRLGATDGEFTPTISRELAST